jgi:Xaa-Pro dipeptidase
VYPHQAERLTAALERKELEALVATTPENVAYVTGFRSPIPPADRRTEVYGVFTRGGTALIVPAVELVTAAVEGVDVDHVRGYGRPVYADPGRGDATADRLRQWPIEPTATPAGALAAVLDRLGVAHGKVGIDEAGVTPPGWRRLGDGLPGRALVEASALLGVARSVKGPWEIECLERALLVAEEALNVVIQTLKPGVTEREAAQLFEHEVARRGGHADRTLVLTGPRTAYPAVPPSDRAVKPGELVRFDVGATFRGYRTEVARTAVMGAPTAAQADAHAAIARGIQAALDAVRPGVTAAAVFGAAVEAVRAAGLAGYERDDIGHGIGLAAREAPALAPGNATPLEQTMILAVELAHYDPALGGVQVKETVVVTRADGRALNHSIRGLVALD